ncbi:MAG: hypothetical protein IPG56_18850 [Caulobacteraceae bacterium]|nr:hypothetical protein [Caulobacteraceae bacterium]
MQVTQDLCGDAVEKLDVRGAGVLRAELVLFGVDGRDRIIGVNVSKPLREVKPLMRLFREKLNVVGENFDAEFGFEAARLDVVHLAPIDETQREPGLPSKQAGKLRADQLRCRYSEFSAWAPNVWCARNCMKITRLERAAAWRSAQSEYETNPQSLRRWRAAPADPCFRRRNRSKRWPPSLTARRSASAGGA